MTLKVKLTPPLMQIIADVISVFISYTVQYYIRFQSGWYGSSINFEPEIFMILGSILVCYWILVFWFSGLYKNWYIRSPFDEFFTIIKVTFFGSFIIFFIWWLDSESRDPRLLFLLYFIVFSIFVLIGRYMARIIQRFLRQKGIVVISAIILGTYSKAKELFESITRSTNWGYNTLGIILVDGVISETGKPEENYELRIRNYEKELIDENPNVDKTENDKALIELPVIGYDDDVYKAIERLKPEELLITVNSPRHDFLLNLVSYCAERKITVKIIPDLYEFFTGQARTLHLYGIPLIEVNTQLLKPWQELAKRFFDIIFSTFVILAGLPIWLIIGLIVKLETNGPMFYRQVRTGKNGKEFKIIKFRSMVQDAESKSGPQWAKVNDPRVTKFGKFLRSTHLDEIPQFFNALIGDMSIVGPRPERPVFVEKFIALVPAYRRRLIVRPGITGWWQVKYTTYSQSTIEIENRLKDDFFYIENMSFKLDLEIIIRTIFLVIKGHGQT